MPPKKQKPKKNEKDKPKVELTPQKPKKPPPPPACFSAEEVADFKKLFQEHDETSIDKVPLDVITLIFRKMGFNPTDEQMETLFKMFLEDEFVDLVEFHEFLFMLEQKIAWGDDVETVVVDAFKAFDEGETGLLEFEHLKNELQKWGDVFTDEEFEEMPKMAKKELLLKKEEVMPPLFNCKFYYEKFVETLNSKDEKYLPEPINYWKLDQKALLEIATRKAGEERKEQDKRDELRRLREEARQAKLIEAGLMQK